MKLVVCTSSDNALYLYLFCESISKGFRVMDGNKNIRAKLGWSQMLWDVCVDGQTDGKQDPYIAPCLSVCVCVRGGGGGGVDNNPS